KLAASPSNKRYIVFPHGSSSPKYLTSSEIENIMLTNNKYWFVRKVKYEDLMVMLNKDMLS
ncbi:glycogen branching protein, partial [Citrobacter freundii]|nr:glycogen branching protein [Citrobacter freundii]